MATIREVAALAGVSLSTVSIVINGQAAERKITDATCKKVWDAVEQLGVPSQHRRPASCGCRTAGR